MELDSLRAEEEARADLLVRESLRCRERDLELLRCQLLMDYGPAGAQALPARPQLSADPLRPGPGAKALECLKSLVELLASEPALPKPSKPLTVGESRPGPLPVARLVLMQLECGVEGTLGVGVLGE
jgi:hypothetical protein